MILPDIRRDHGLTDMSENYEKTPEQKRGIRNTVIVLVVIVVLGFISAFLKTWK